MGCSGVSETEGAVFWVLLELHLAVFLGGVLRLGFWGLGSGA